MSTRTAAGFIAFLLLAIGLVVGFAVTSSIDDPAIGVVHCGSAFAPSEDAKAADLGVGLAGRDADFEGQCSSQLGGARIAAIILAGIGGVGLLFVGLTWNQGIAKGPRPEPPREGSEPGAQGGAKLPGN